MSKEQFKTFVKAHPHLIDKVHQQEFTWQELYEAYDLYGEEAPLFQAPKPARTQSGKVNFQEMAELFRNVDLESVQKGIVGLQKAVSLLQNLGHTNEEAPTPYQERPMYKYYED